MGYTPGEFICKINGPVHWELKDGGRVVLWNANESDKLLDLDPVEAMKACEQLKPLAEP